MVELGNTAGMLLLSPLDSTDHALYTDLTYCNLGTNTCKIASMNHQCVPLEVWNFSRCIPLQNCRISSPVITLSEVGSGHTLSVKVVAAG